MKGNNYMNTSFHGSDLEEISQYYNIPQEDIVNFAANVNPLGISDTLKETLVQNLDVISTYPDRSYTNLRNVLANYCNTIPQHLMVGNGSTELISLLISNIKASKCLLLGPTYSEYEKELNLIGCSLEEYKLSSKNDFQLDMEDFCQTLGNGFDFLILCNPNNPTGTILDIAQLEQLCLFCQDHHIFIMIDETYIEFSSNLALFTAIPLTKTYANLMILRGISKFYAAPGLRMGYGITSNQNVLEHLKLHQNPWSLNSIAALACEFMFTDLEYQHKTHQLIQEEKQRCYEQFKNNPDFKCYKTEANFILIQLCNPKFTADQIFQYCISKGFMIRNCNSFFGKDGEFIRFCFMNPSDNARLIQHLLSYTL